LPAAGVHTPTAAAVGAGKKTGGVSSPVSPSPGRGSRQHKLVQELARQWGEALGFRVAVEQDILGGAGRVDVLMSRGDLRIAVEVSVTSTARQVAETVSKCLAAGLSQVVVVGSDVSALRQAEELTMRETPAKDRSRVRFLSPDGLKTWLESLPGTPDDENRTAGYEVRVKSAWKGGDANRRILARLLGAALLRRKASP
jgi:hypothetical protein